MRLSVVGWPLQKFEVLAKCLKDLSSLIGEDLVTLSGHKDAGFVTITTLKQLGGKLARSDKSGNSEKPASQPLKLQINTTLFNDGSVLTNVYYAGKTDRLVGAASRSLKGEKSRTDTLTFTVDTSPKPTSTGTTYSKDELLTLLRKNFDEMDYPPEESAEGLTEWGIVERFIKRL
jgi:hypothetical protein